MVILIFIWYFIYVSEQEMFELKRENRQLAARKVTHYGTDTKAVMNCDVAQFEKQFIVAVGLEGHCRMYTLRYKVITPKVENEGGILLICECNGIYFFLFSKLLTFYQFFVIVQCSTIIVHLRFVYNRVFI